MVTGMALAVAVSLAAQAPAGHPVHHYILEIYALNAKLGLPPEATREQFTAALVGKILSRGTSYGKATP
jgi:phosphatidylethanolamine-binding protein (PEBP) family uncharacterized protein